jgi:RNA polymerase sigma factor (sigma-70 family)
MPSRINEVVKCLYGTALPPEEAALTDGQLLGRFLECRDQAAVTALVQRHGPMVWGVCRRILGHHHEAEDAFQATFLVLVRKAGSVRRRELVGNWLYGVAHQTALKARATRARRQTRERQGTAMPEPPAPEQDVWHDLHPVLDQELSRLPEIYRVAIVLCDLEGKTRKEAARQLGCPEGTLAARLTRARTMLAKRLARHGPAVSGGALAAVLAPKAALAGVPPAVLASTIRAATAVAAGQAVAGVIPAEVAALTEGILKTMLLSKIKATTFALLMAAVAGILAGLACGALAGEGPSQKREDQTRSARPNPAEGGQPMAPERAAEQKPQEHLKEQGIRAEVRGILRFEDGSGAFLSVKPARKGMPEMQVWLLYGEDKVTARRLEKLLGKEVVAKGELAQMPVGTQGSRIPPLGMYLSRFEIGPLGKAAGGADEGEAGKVPDLMTRRSPTGLLTAAEAARQAAILKRLKKALQDERTNAGRLALLAKAVKGERDVNFRRHLLEIAIEMPGPQLEKFLTDLLAGDDDAGIRSLAATTLGLKGSAGCLKALAHAAAKDRTTRVVFGDMRSESSARRAATFAIAQLAVRFPAVADDAAAELRALPAAANAEDNESLADARLQALYQVTQDRALLKPFYERLKSADARARARAVNAFQFLKLRQAPAEIVRALKDTSPDVRRQTALVLGRIGDPKTGAALMGVAGDSKEDTSARCNAIFALGHMKHRASATLLEKLLNDPAPAVRANAAVAFYRITGRKMKQFPEGYRAD